jgi:hypothetical protein
MKRPRLAAAAAAAAAVAAAALAPRPALAGHELTVDGTRFLLDGKPFPFTGVSFFNAIYNKAFNESSAARRTWLRKFQRYGVNALRVWGQWDSRRGYADTCETCTLYDYRDGALRRDRVETLKAILKDADAEGTVVELALFAQESWKAGITMPDAALDRAVADLAKELAPFRNLAIQIWNEYTHRTVELVGVVKKVDPRRLVTSSPGVAGVLGDDAQNRVLDYLSPHTSRQGWGRTWEVAPRELAYLLARFKKPVLDDEPARNGTKSFGGPGETTYPTDHILHTHEIWKVGAYALYHHDMFQTGYGTPAVPAHGIPDPEFSPYHRAVFEFLAQRDRYMPAALRGAPPAPPAPPPARPRAATPGAAPGPAHASSR